MPGLLGAAAAGDAAAVLQDVDALLSQGRGLEMFCHDAIATLRALMFVRICGPDSEIVDIPAGARDDYVKLSKAFAESQCVQMIAMLEQLRRNVRYSGAGRALTDALMVRFARMAEWAPIEDLLKAAPPAADAAPEKKKTAPPLAAGRTERAGKIADVKRLGRTITPRGPHAARTARPDAAPTNPPDTATFSAPTIAVAVADPALAVSRPAQPLNGAERARALKDPVVRQLVELFDGVVVDVERQVGPPRQAPVTGPAGANDTAEADDNDTPE